jgi:acyl carrier protein
MSTGGVCWDRESIRGLLVEILEADVGTPFADLRETDRLREGLGLDSVDVVSMVAQVERRFHVRLSHQELEALADVGDVIDLLHAKLNAPGTEAVA